MKAWKAKNIKLFNADFLELKMPDSFVDLIITSPPYNIGIDYGIYNDNKTYKEYLEFSKKWLTKCFSILQDGGRICINIPIDTRDRSLSADLTILAKKTGFKYKGTIIWNKQNVKNKYTFVFSKNIELILIFYKKEWKGVKKEFKEWVNNIWTFAGENPKRVNHPAPFPVEIPRRLIKMFSNMDDVILDPFLGSGTTLVACELLGRKGVGVEIDKKYFEIVKNRLINKKW